jgi:hypothetical protein
VHIGRFQIRHAHESQEQVILACSLLQSIHKQTVEKLNRTDAHRDIQTTEGSSTNANRNQLGMLLEAAE